MKRSETQIDGPIEPLDVYMPKFMNELWAAVVAAPEKALRWSRLRTKYSDYTPIWAFPSFTWNEKDGKSERVFSHVEFKDVIVPNGTTAELRNDSLVLHFLPIMSEYYHRGLDFFNQVEGFFEGLTHFEKKRIEKRSFLLLWQSILVRTGSEWILYERTVANKRNPAKADSHIFLQRRTDRTGVVEKEFFMMAFEENVVYAVRYPTKANKVVIPLPRPIWDFRQYPKSLTALAAGAVAKMLPTLTDRDFPVSEDLKEFLVKAYKDREVVISQCYSCQKEKAAFVSSMQGQEAFICSQLCSDAYWTKHLETES